MTKNTKEGRQQLLREFIRRSDSAVVERTNFAVGSKVYGVNSDLGITVVVTQDYGVAVNFSGYGWQTRATAEQQKYLLRLAKEVNGLTEFDDLRPLEGPQAP